LSIINLIPNFGKRQKIFKETNGKIDYIKLQMKIIEINNKIENILKNLII